jgi:hypothetical protein
MRFEKENLMRPLKLPKIINILQLRDFSLKGIDRRDRGDVSGGSLGWLRLSARRQSLGCQLFAGPGGFWSSGRFLGA